MSDLVWWLVFCGTSVIVGVASYHIGRRDGHRSGRRTGWLDGWQVGRDQERQRGIDHLPDILDTNPERREEAPRDPDAPGVVIHESRWTNGYW